MDVRRLSEVPRLSDELARWYEREWEPYYGTSGPGSAEDDLAEALGEGLPVCLVALDEGGSLVGSISLRAEPVVSDFDLTPWVAAMLVRPGHAGVVEAMVSALIAEAGALGHRSLHVETDPDDPILAGRQWHRIGRSGSLRGELGVYELRIGETTYTPEGFVDP